MKSDLLLILICTIVIVGCTVMLQLFSLSASSLYRFLTGLNIRPSQPTSEPKGIDSDVVVQAILVIGVLVLFGISLYFYLWRYLIAGNFGDLQVLLIVSGFVQTIIGYYFGRVQGRILQSIHTKQKGGE